MMGVLYVPSEVIPSQYKSKLWKINLALWSDDGQNYCQSIMPNDTLIVLFIILMNRNKACYHEKDLFIPQRAISFESILMAVKLLELAYLPLKMEYFSQTRLKIFWNEHGKFCKFPSERVLIPSKCHKSGCFSLLIEVRQS